LSYETNLNLIKTEKSNLQLLQNNIEILNLNASNKNTINDVYRSLIQDVLEVAIT